MEKWAIDYNSNFKKIEKDLQILANEIEDLLERNNMHYHKIEFRVKQIQSIKNKLQNQKLEFTNPIKEMWDILGIRIITYYIDDVKPIVDLIDRIYSHYKKFYSDDYTEDTYNKFGYMRDHLILRIDTKINNKTKNKLLKNYLLEIQVRTLLGHTWAEISHEIDYKENDKSLPLSFRRELIRLSAVLELADYEFKEIRKSKAKLTSSNLNAELNQSLDISITKESLIAFLDFKNYTTIWSMIAMKLGYQKYPLSEIVNERLTISSLLTLLQSLNISKINELDLILKEAKKWGEKFLNDLLVKSKEYGYVPIANPFVLIEYLILFKNKDQLTEEMLSPEGYFYPEIIERSLIDILEISE